MPTNSPTNPPPDPSVPSGPSDDRPLRVQVAEALGWTDCQLGWVFAQKEWCGTHPSKTGGFSNDGRMVIPPFDISVGTAWKLVEEKQKAGLNFIATQGEPTEHKARRVRTEIQKMEDGGWYVVFFHYFGGVDAAGDGHGWSNRPDEQGLAEAICRAFLSKWTPE